MQLGTKEHEDERFNHYIEKSYRKTASLIANSCKAVRFLLALVVSRKFNCSQSLIIFLRSMELSCLKF